MMNLLKKLAACGLSLTMILSLAACGGTDDASSGESGGEPVKYLIGISQYGQHGSLDNCREGFMAGLAEEGIEEGKNLTVLYENANGRARTLRWTTRTPTSTTTRPPKSARCFPPRTRT